MFPSLTLIKHSSMAASMYSSLHIYSPPFSPQYPSKILNPSIVIKLHKSSFLCFSSKKKTNFMDQILDYIEGGPKLRKWYGAPELLPKDGGPENEDESQEVEEARDAVLVTDGDSEIGQMVILSLIVKRARVKALVKDKRAAVEAFGTYVESIAGNVNDPPLLKKTLRGVRAIICPSNEGLLSDLDSLKGVQHLVLLSQLAAYRGSSGIQALIQSNSKKVAEKNESVVMSSGIPYTIIRAGSLQDTPGGNQGFSFEEGSAAKGRLSKEDAAFICVEALNAVPQRGLVFEVVNGEGNVADWKEWFASMIEKTDDQQLQ